jgi:hypothetical protein
MGTTGRAICMLALAVGASSAEAAITNFSATLEANWPSTSEVPLLGSANVALDDSTNELSWEVQWAGSSARRAQVTMVGPDCAESDCPRGGGRAMVLDLADDVSTVDVRGGELSGSLHLTPEQVLEFGNTCEAWRVEVMLWDKRGVALQGELELSPLPPGIWL